MKTKILIIFTLILSLPLLNGCQIDRNQIYTRTNLSMGTIATVSIYQNGSERILDECFERLSAIEQSMSKTYQNNTVDSINNANGALVELDQDLYNVIDRALYYGELSNGSFDITIAPVVNLWKIGSSNPYLPEVSEIDPLLDLVDYTKVKLDENNLTIQMPSGFEIDLGGIAKGYAADELIAFLEEAGVTSAYVNIGGNVKVLGQKPEGSNFRVGVQKPFSFDGDYFAILSVKDKTVVTSGDYERYFTVDEVNYHHIFDPVTGFPVENDLRSVTVITDSSLDADALSTIIFTKGFFGGLILAQSLENVDVIFVTKENEIHFSRPEIQEYFQLVDEEYIIAE